MSQYVFAGNVSQLNLKLRVRQKRVVLAVTSVLYPAWAFVALHVNSQAADSFSERAGISLILWLVCALSFLPRFTDEQRFIMIKCCKWLLVFHFFTLVARNHVATQYAIVAFFVVFLAAGFFNSRKGLLSFVPFVLGLSAFCRSENPDLPSYAFQLGLATCLAMSYLSLMNRLKLEEALHESERTFRTMFETAGVGMAIVELDGRVKRANQLFSKIFGLSATQLNNSHFDQLTGGEKAHSFEVAIADLLKGERSRFQFETLLSRKDSTLSVWAKISCSLITPQNSPGFILAIVEDLSEQKRQEKILGEQQARINHTSKMTALGEMASGIAHEVNNPIAVISASMSLLTDHLQREDLDPQTVKKTIDRVLRTVDRIAKIINGLRRFARDGKHDPLEPSSIATIIQDTVDLVTQNLQGKGIKMTVENPTPDAMAFCRPVEISQVLLNLFTNAVDAIGDDDDADAEGKWIKVVVISGDDHVQIRVLNSGKKMPSALMDKIFQPFYTTKPTGQGTGLGLSISLGIMKTHHGNLTLDRKALNTCFVVQIPKTPPHAGLEAGSSAPQAA